MTETSEKSPLVTLPGERLCLADNVHVSGRGTYERLGYIYSQLCGYVNVIEKNNLKVVEVHNPKSETAVPTPGDIVTAQVYIITHQFARCWIKCIGKTVLKKPFRAILRREDIRATEKDRIEMYKCYRPGDIILARVLPIQEAHSYQLTTAENELGVAIAHSAYGHPMVPVSWTEMQCVKTFIKEFRKVAKIVPDNFTKDKKSEEETNNK